VILPEGARLPRVRDSKTIPEPEREELELRIRESATAWNVAFAGVDEIREFNILQATRRAMRRAVLGLAVPADCLLVDFLSIDLPLPQEGLVKGDAKSKSIAAASILAKVARDRLMRELDVEYPQFGLARNKGYGTAEHLRALREHGPCPQHRLEFAPIPAVMAERNQRELFQHG
jgi:ribonuclease HII